MFVVDINDLYSFSFISVLVYSLLFLLDSLFLVHNSSMLDLFTSFAECSPLWDCYSHVNILYVEVPIFYMENTSFLYHL